MEAVCDEMVVGEIGRQRHCCGAGVHGFGYMRRGGLTWKSENGTSGIRGFEESGHVNQGLWREWSKAISGARKHKVGKGGIWERGGEKVRWLQQVAQMWKQKALHEDRRSVKCMLLIWGKNIPIKWGAKVAIVVNMVLKIRLLFSGIFSKVFYFF